MQCYKFYDLASGEGLTSFKGKKRASFVGEKSTMKFSVVSTLENR